jgi:hypothetical protein
MRDVIPVSGAEQMLAIGKRSISSEATQRRYLFRIEFSEILIRVIFLP